MKAAACSRSPLQIPFSQASQLQLAMTAVLGGELFHLLQETG